MAAARQDAALADLVLESASCCSAGQTCSLGCTLFYFTHIFYAWSLKCGMCSVQECAAIDSLSSSEMATGMADHSLMVTSGGDA